MFTKKLKLLLTVCLALGAPAASGAAPPAKKPQMDKAQMLAVEVRKLEGEIHKLQAEELRELRKIRDKYAARLAKLDKPEDKMEAEVAKLRAEEWSELRRAVDPARAKAIKEKYAPQIADLEMEIKAKEAEMSTITKTKDADIAKLEGAWRVEMAKLDKPEDKMEAQVAKLRSEERAELHRLLDPAEVKKIKATFDPKIADLEKKVKALEEGMRDLDKQRKADESKIEAALKAALAKLDPPEDKLEDKLSRLRAQRKAAMAQAATADEKKEVQAEFDGQIKVLQVQIKALEVDMGLAQQLAKKQMEPIEAAYRAEIAKLDPPEDRLEGQVIHLRHEEQAEIAKLADPAKIKAVHAEYDGRIDELKKKVRAMEGALSQRTRKMQADSAAIIAAWRAQIAKLDPPEDKLEHKVFMLKAKEQAELRKALDPDKVKAIRAKFDPQRGELEKKIKEKEHEMGLLAQKQRAEMKKVIGEFNVKLAPLKKQVDDLLRQIVAPKK